MVTVTIHQAKTQLSRLIARVEAGEEIVIARGKEPVAKLSGLGKRKKPRFGAFAGEFAVPPGSFFFDPLPAEELELWEGGSDYPTG